MISKDYTTGLKITTRTHRDDPDKGMRNVSDVSFFYIPLDVLKVMGLPLESHDSNGVRFFTVKIAINGHTITFFSEKTTAV